MKESIIFNKHLSTCPWCSQSSQQLLMAHLPNFPLPPRVWQATKQLCLDHPGHSARPDIQITWIHRNAFRSLQSNRILKIIIILILPYINTSGLLEFSNPWVISLPNASVFSMGLRLIWFAILWSVSAIFFFIFVEKTVSFPSFLSPK